MRCDVKCYDLNIKMAGYGQQCTIVYWLYLVTFFLAYNMSVLIGEKDFV